MIGKGGLIPAKGGYFRPTTVGPGGSFAGQITWKPTSLTPQRIASVQMIAIQVAITSALADVEKSIARVEGKGDDLLALAKAEVIGDVVGTHAYLGRLTDEVERNDALPTSDWEAVAALGPAIEQGLERIRAYVRATTAKLDPSASLSSRATTVETVAKDDRLGEAMHLLTIAEQTYLRWQNLRLRRVVDTEPQHREAVHRSVRAALAGQAHLDIELWDQIYQRLNGFEAVQPLEIGRFRSVAKLTENTRKLQADLDDFRRTRAQQIRDWERLDAPGVRDAISELGGRANNVLERGASVTSAGLLRTGDALEKGAVVTSARLRTVGSRVAGRSSREAEGAPAPIAEKQAPPSAE